MGMRPHIQSMAGHELARSHLIKENERADHLPLAGWQRPAHLKPSNVVGAGYDDGLDGRGPLRECALITFQGYLPTPAIFHEVAGDVLLRCLHRFGLDHRWLAVQRMVISDHRRGFMQEIQSQRLF